MRTSYVYFITIRAVINRSPFVVHTLNELILNILREEQERQNCPIFTYCLMPDHLHFPVSPKKEGVSVLRFTDQFKGKSTNQSGKAGWSGKLWQPRYYDHIVRAGEELVMVARYILNNPVRKNLVAEPEDWPWSGHLNPLNPLP
jgi:putative transposase